MMLTSKTLGYSGTAMDAYFNRIRMRYTPEDATEDVVFYPSGIIKTTKCVSSFIKRSWSHDTTSVVVTFKFTGGDDSYPRYLMNSTMPKKMVDVTPVNEIHLANV